jgi:hypothetical protein
VTKCPLCHRRKGRRLCPASDTMICSHCCGTKRRAEIACPEDCVYLAGAHAGPWEGRTTEKDRDARRLARFLAPLSEGQQQLMLLSLKGVAALAARRQQVDDRLLVEAVSTLRRTTETRQKGILYEHQADDARAQALVIELADLFQIRDPSGRAATPSDSDLLAALKALEGAIAATAAEAAGPRAFLETATRVTADLDFEPPRETTGLIVP